MSSERQWGVAKISEIPPGQPNFMTGWHSVRKHFGISAFGINAVTKNAGEIPIPEHTEDDQEEVFFVSQGKALFTMGGEEIEVDAGSFVFAQPQVRRGAKALSSPTTILVMGAKSNTHTIAEWDK